MSETFLIVDDSRLARMMAAGLITERLPDSSVVEATNADDALGMLEKIAPRHIFLDHNMPGRNGLELVADIRELAPAASITLVTANIQSAIRERAEQFGCRFIAKPLTGPKLDVLLSALAEEP